MDSGIYSFGLSYFAIILLSNLTIFIMVVRFRLDQLVELKTGGPTGIVKSEEN